jgi:hypothetical protein
MVRLAIVFIDVLSHRVSAAMAFDMSAIRPDCSAMLVLVSALRMPNFLSDWLMGIGCCEKVDRIIA